MSDIDRLTAALADRYAIERELGSGGMATVYLAEDLKLHRKVAVKVLRPELAAALGPERFLREIEIAASLTHPHILPLYDSGESEGFLYYVMPYVEGESLQVRGPGRCQIRARRSCRLGCRR
jgi:serine/threonine-protein kinase